VHRWRLLAVTSLMLEAIRQIYETERQPETLAEASTYLVRLTEGRYRRVWTPLSEDILRIDTAGGESLPLDVLSQGTREAVFLSLRLALAAAYARRGALLPLVLDDVLVNLDVKRAKMAAEVLRDFATSGHQMLLFTCHHHILRIFEAAHVEVRLLPVREGMDLSDWADENELLEPEIVEADTVAEDSNTLHEERVEEAQIHDDRHEPDEPVIDDGLEEETTQDEGAENVAREDDECGNDEDESPVDQDVEEIETVAELEEDDADTDEPLDLLWDEQQELHLADDDDRFASVPTGSNLPSFADRWWESDATPAG
jgi:hypothetical protein